ncbi:MAG: DUF1018 domain-containing protein [Nitrospinae bacterium]|nr:DUF1018 domain-containing protein [Nitrospinota bacterium]
MGKVIAISSRQSVVSSQQSVAGSHQRKKSVVKDFKYRREMIAKIHIAKKDMKICKSCNTYTFYVMCQKCHGEDLRQVEDLDYRRALFRLTKKISCKDMTGKELRRVLEAFKTVGFQASKRVSLKGAVNNVRRRMAEALKREAEKILGEYWENRLKGFCRKAFDKWDVGLCSIKELKVCFGFLRKVEKGMSPQSLSGEREGI